MCWCPLCQRFAWQEQVDRIFYLASRKSCVYSTLWSFITKKWIVRCTMYICRLKKLLAMPWWHRLQICNFLYSTFKSVCLTCWLLFKWYINIFPGWRYIILASIVYPEIMFYRWRILSTKQTWWNWRTLWWLCLARILWLILRNLRYKEEILINFSICSPPLSGYLVPRLIVFFSLTLWIELLSTMSFYFLCSGLVFISLGKARRCTLYRRAHCIKRWVP